MAIPFDSIILIYNLIERSSDTCRCAGLDLQIGGQAWRHDYRLQNHYMSVFAIMDGLYWLRVRFASSIHSVAAFT